MFPKANRLSGPDFANLSDAQKKMFGWFFIKYKKSQIMKISVIVPKKIEKSAVKRNKMKRRVLHILKSKLNTPVDNYLIAIYLTKNILNYPQVDLESDIQKMTQVLR